MNIVILLSGLINIIIIGLYGRYIGRRGMKTYIILNSIINMLILIICIMTVIEIESIWQLNKLTLGINTLDLALSIINNNYIYVALIIIVGNLVLIYAIDYMWIEKDLNKLLGLLYSFICIMIIYVISTNIISLFTTWELMGLLSALLVAYYKDSVYSITSSIKTLGINRIGDFTLCLLQYYILSSDGTADILDYLDIIGVILTIPSILSKSALNPLHNWLPNAMAAPTPVSSLLHAATMVTAGLYLIVKLPWIPNTLVYLIIILLIGYSIILTGSISLYFYDFKKIIAFSTCSQMALIALCLGNLCIESGILHLYTHALFKALLFLSAGNIIHALNDSQDLRNIGNIALFMPISCYCFIIGSLALSGLPFTASFYSKDFILDTLYLDNSLLSIFSYYAIIISIILTISYAIRPVFYLLYHISYNPIRILSIHIIRGSEMYTMFPIILLAILSIAITLIIDCTIYSYNSTSIIIMFIPLLLSYLIYLFTETSEFEYNISNQDNILKMYYFDYLYRKFIIISLYLSYNITFKLLDKGFLQNITSFLPSIFISNLSINSLYRATRRVFGYISIILGSILLILIYFI